MDPQTTDTPGGARHPRASGTILGLSLGSLAALAALGALAPGEAGPTWSLLAGILLVLFALPLGAVVRRLPDEAARRFAWPPTDRPSRLVLRLLGLYLAAALAGALLNAATIFHYVTTIGHFAALAAILQALVWPPKRSRPRRRRADATVLGIGALFYLEWTVDRRVWWLEGEIPWAAWFALLAAVFLAGALLGRGLVVGSLGEAVRRRLLAGPGASSTQPVRPRATVAAHLAAAGTAVLVAFGLATLHRAFVASSFWPFHRVHPTFLGVDWYWLTAADLARAAQLGVLLAFGLAVLRGLFLPASLRATAPGTRETTPSP